jgi:clan AA aspartic protease (TIGR02281 family)
VKCVKCQTDNKNSLHYCENCGAPLPVIKRPWGKIFAALAVLLICAAVLAHLSRDTAPPVQPKPDAMTSVHKEALDKRRRIMPVERGTTGQAARKTGPAAQVAEKEMPPVPVPQLKKEEEIIAGWITITDPWGRQVRQFRSGVTGDGWLALPARACIGGNSWQFLADSGGKVEISGGLWISGDRVGLWHISEESSGISGPQLSSWNKGEPVKWISLESDDTYDDVRLSPGLSDGFFVSSPLPDNINETGVFFQHGRVVGWSFGQWLARGYMWMGKKGAELEYKTWVRYFYNMTFANGREEKFAEALAMQKGHAGLEQLAAFIEGFRLQPKLIAEDTPDYLLPGEIVKRMRVLVSYAVNQGEGSSVAELLNGQVLMGIGDMPLFMDVVPIVADARGFEAAIGEIEDTGRYIERQSGREAAELGTRHYQLYKDWLQSLAAAGEVDRGWQVYNAAVNYYPDDPSIHLLGVELAILNGDWEEAERLLYMRDYPPAFQDRYQLLALRISELKGEEEKIVIRFPRGSGRVPVTAVMNETLSQDFLVDTGATMVTVPSSAADVLGFEVVSESRRLSTASGVVTVREVIIDEIEIDGWVEYNIRAVVLDLPGRPNLGLLGLSYLSRFQMDLNTAEGTLLLAPR